MEKTMRAQMIEAPNKMSLQHLPIPEINDDEVLVKVKMCGICGTDLKIYAGLYAADHSPRLRTRVLGSGGEGGKNAKGVNVGDRVSADICLTCGTCYFCRREGLLCQSFTQLGIHTNGAFAEYVKAPWKNCYLIPQSVDDYSAAFIEPMTAVLEASKRMACTMSSQPLSSSAAAWAPPCRDGEGSRSRARHRDRRQQGAPRNWAGRWGSPISSSTSTRRRPPRRGGTPHHRRDRRGFRAGGCRHAGDLRAGVQDGAPRRRGGGLRCGSPGQDGIVRAVRVRARREEGAGCAGIGNDWAEVINLLTYKRIDPRPLFSLPSRWRSLNRASTS